MEPPSADDKTAAVRRTKHANLFLASVVALTLVAGSGTRATAQSGGNDLEERSVNSFRFDPGAGVVRVTIDVDLRNTTTDRVEGNVINRTFFEEYAVAVPLGAENIVATSNGVALVGTLVSDPEFPAFSTYRFALGTQLFSGESFTARVTYDHLGAPPRDPVPWRVNEAYAGFAAFGLGDDGLVTIRISQPAGYEFDEFTDLSGFDAGPPDEVGTIEHTRSGLDGDIRITVGLANDDRLESRPLDVEGVDVELRSWPDDPEWASFAAAKVEAGIPALEQLIGSTWPVEGSFDVRQTVEPNLRGYAGWFDARSNEIAVGEALDADTIYHELSHAWFNSRLSTERWLTEGLAQVYAAELVGRDGDEARTPTEPAAGDPAARPLTDWTALDSDRAVEEFGYATSFWVVDALVDDIGVDRTAEVIAALRSGASPYGDAAQVERPGADWQRVYDVFVEIGGADAARELFGSHVVDADGAASIDRRDRAATDVAGLAERSSPWELPVGVRHRLERWEIDDVIDATIDADLVLERRSELETIETSVGIDEPERADDAYGAAPMRAGGGVDFTEATAILDAAIELGEQLEDRVASVSALASDADATPPRLSAVAGVEDFTTGLAAADAQIRALERIVEVDALLHSASGVMASIGRWGSDAEADLDEARAHVARGDNEAALATLDAAERQVDDLARTGAVRVAIGATVLLALLAALLWFGAVSRRRPRADSVT
jgi:hypothetical protein